MTDQPAPRADPVLRAVAGGLSAVLLLAALLLLTPLAGDAGRAAAANLLQLALAALAAVTSAAWAGRCSGRRRLAWAGVAVGCAGWAAGQAVWTWYEQVAKAESPFPSWADAGFLLFPVGLSMALWLYPGGGSWRQRRRLLDALTVTCALALVSWSTVLRQVVEAGADDRLGLVVSVAYPASDLVVIVLTVLILAARRTERISLGLLGAGLVAFGLADSAFAYLTATGRFSTGQVVDLGWMLGFALIALAPLAARETEAVDEDGRATAGPSLAPYLAVVVAAVVAAWRHLVGGGLEPTEQALVAATVVLVLARQFTTLRENSALVEVLAAREAELRHQAFHDGLTGLANRALFIDRLEHALALHASDLRPLAVVLCDLDDFKVVNDRLGHAVGDELLLRVSERLRGALRTADTLARLGGDEFAVLLEHGDEADTVAARLGDALDTPFSVGGSSVRVRASIGLAVVEPGAATPSSGDLLVRADTAMYTAKRSGKGRVRLYTPGMSLAEIEEQHLAEALASALSRRELHVVYQPIVAVETGEVEGVECLVRWTWEGRDVPPSELVPVAERAGLIADLTDFVLDEACAQLAAWTAELGSDRVRVGVNVAPQDLVGGTLPGRVAAALRRHRLDPDRLVLEIAGTGLLTDLDATQQATMALSRLGVRLALDDFGVGSSPLAHLHRIPLQLLKIDRAFTAGLGVATDQERFVRALLTLGADLGLSVVAVGIDRPEQLARLRALGCEMAQGTFLSPPLPAADVLPLLRVGVAAGRLPVQRRGGAA